MHLETTPNHLIMVPGHATFKGDIIEFPADPYADDPWILQPFQAGEPPFYIEHIQGGIDLLVQDPSHSLLMFSGGLTRNGTHWREADTYNAIAEYLLQQQGLQHLAGQLAIEGFARDSFENVDFSRRRFVQLFGSYPLRMTVVGWDFKEKRFRLHANALEVRNFAYYSRNHLTGDAREAAVQGEVQTIEDYIKYPHGEGGKPHRVRLERNLSPEPIPYPGVPELTSVAA